ncbi:MAG: hypothetical protein M3122_03975 [Actinomycetota bacterium]|nr:hypothetical protein [Actinomycetota bacterium]
MDVAKSNRAGDERNVARVLHNAQQEAEACGGYAAGAKEAGNELLAGFFGDVRETHIKIARRAEEMLGRPDGLHAGIVRPGSIRLGDGPSEGDPGDVSPGQDDVA